MSEYEEGFQAGLETKWSSKEAGLRRAVIKAARRYLWANDAGVPTGEFVDYLRDAIQALDKAEADDE